MQLEILRNFTSKNTNFWYLPRPSAACSLAGGANTYKMKFGHHGANHPVQDISSKEVFITSQNHGFAVDIDSLPANIEVTHISLFDKSFKVYNSRGFTCFSFRLSRSPGPQEIQTLFNKFSLMIKKYVKT